MKVIIIRFFAQTFRAYLEVHLMNLVSVAVILNLSLALIAQVSFPQRRAGKANVLQIFMIILL
jgi:hypothetical protein